MVHLRQYRFGSGAWKCARPNGACWAACAYCRRGLICQVPKIFRRGESSAANPAGERKLLKSATLARNAGLDERQRFVDRDRRFGLNECRTNAAFGAAARKQDAPADR